MGAFMRAFNQELLASRELVEIRGLSAPVRTRRVQIKEGDLLATDGPCGEADKVLAGYWVVDCERFDRATEIASRLGGCPGPEHVRVRAYEEVRPIDEHQPDFEG
ncbi:MAG: YciI family protein [Candidatus Dormibacteria bacterium]